MLPKPAAFRTWRECLEAARKECIARAHAELGAGAVFLNEETRQEERWLGLVRREIVEMLFASEIEGSALEKPETPPASVTEARPSSPPPSPAPAASPTSLVPAPIVPAPENVTLERLEGEVQDLASSVRALTREVASGGFTPLEVTAQSQARGLTHPAASAPPPPSLPAPEPVRNEKRRMPTHPVLRALLARAETPEPLAEALLAHVPLSAEGEEARSLLRAAVRDIFRTQPFIEPVRGQKRVIALVGPTGVGKTTTIAKLAAPFALAGTFRVGMVTLDTYRIAAVEQLRTYGEIMGVPVRVAHSRRGIEEALESLADRDVIFVDTAGRSQKNRGQIGELRDVLTGEPWETHLVLSATAKLRDLSECAREFAVVEPKSLIFTKLDETNTLGSLLGVVAEAALPVSYVTTGQRVPEDIEPADPVHLAVRFLEPAA